MSDSLPPISPELSDNELSENTLLLAQAIEAVFVAHMSISGVIHLISLEESISSILIEYAKMVRPEDWRRALRKASVDSGFIDLGQIEPELNELCLRIILTIAKRKLTRSNG